MTYLTFKMTVPPSQVEFAYFNGRILDNLAIIESYIKTALLYMIPNQKRFQEKIENRILKNFRRSHSFIRFFETAGLQSCCS